MDYDLPQVEGVDWEKAHRYMPDKEVLINMLKEFVSSAQSQTEKLKKFRDEVQREPSDDNFAAFRIHAHAMKSTLRSMGSDLFDRALFLEEAGREGRGQDIIEKTDDFAGSYLDLATKMKAVTGEIKESPAFDKEYFIEKIRIIKEAMDDFDVSKLQEAAEEVLKMEIPEKYSDECEKLEEAVRDLSSDEVIGICNSLEEKIQE